MQCKVVLELVAVVVVDTALLGHLKLLLQLTELVEVLE